MIVVEKTPVEVKDVDLLYHRFLKDSDVVQSAVATITGGTAVVGSVEVATEQVKVWISGGDDGDDSHVSVVATTEQGRVEEQCFRLRVRECD